MAIITGVIESDDRRVEIAQLSDSQVSARVKALDGDGENWYRTEQVG